MVICKEILIHSQHQLRIGNPKTALQCLLQAAQLFNEPGTTKSVADQLQGLMAGVGEQHQDVLELATLLSSFSLAGQGDTMTENMMEVCGAEGGPCTRCCVYTLLCCSCVAHVYTQTQTHKTHKHKHLCRYTAGGW